MSWRHTTYLLTLASFLSFGQSKVSIEKTRDLAMANVLTGQYTQALPLLEELDSMEKNNPETNYYLGICYYNSDKKRECYQYFNNAKKFGSKEQDLNYFLARGMQLNHKFEEAISMYKTSVDSSNTDLMSAIGLHVPECQYALELQKRPTIVELHNMGPVVNSKYDEYVPLEAANGTELFFTSKRPNTTGKKKIDFASNEFYEDIYKSTYSNEGWSAPENLPVPVNSKFNDAALAVANDGTQLLVYQSKGNFLKMDGIIYETSLNESGNWNELVELESNINKGSYCPSAMLCNNGETIIFSSDQEGGFGGLDLYIATKQEDGTWSEAKNLGSSVNTSGDEDAADLNPEGDILFFSSNGHKTMGGYDIFVSELNHETKEWSTPQNLGFPVNTADDDLFFVWHSDGSHGYFSSNRPGGFGGHDLYEIHRPDKKHDNLAIGGYVLDHSTGAPLEAALVLKDKENAILSVSYSDPKTGRYAIPVAANQEVTLHIEAEGYSTEETTVQLAESWFFYQEEKDIELHKIDADILFALYNIDPAKLGFLENLMDFESTTIVDDVHFEYNKSSLKTESRKHLDHIVDVLLSFNEVCMEISGHTDNIGNDDYNKELSKKRAKEVGTYLQQNGISKSRLAVIGYGESRPLATNESDSGRSINRRTEFKIIHQQDILSYGEELIPLGKDLPAFKLEELLSQKGGFREGNVLPYALHFPSNSYMCIGGTSKKSLIQLAELMNQRPDLTIKVHSHSDQSNDEMANQWVSNRRAETVVKYLTSEGIDQSRIEVAQDEAKPNLPALASEEELREKRVEFEITAL
jgi:outer membrane protein OmpA-like peptidoglycan-associated protein/tetratricopeptide (TPR) repeat protein